MSESTPSTNERSAKLIILKTSQCLFGKDLAEPELAYWYSIMDSISVPAWRYAFDVWNRNGRFFPKPKDILEGVEAFKIGAAGRFEACGLDGCVDGWKTVTPAGVDRKVIRCQCWNDFRENGFAAKLQHVGQGYGTADIKWLMKAYSNKRASLPNRALTDGEVNTLLDELDRHRGHSPAWRKSA